MPWAQRVEPGTETVRRLRSERKPKVRSLSTNHSAETLRRNANDHDWNSIERSPSSYSGLASAKVFLEVAISQDHRPLRLFPVVIVFEEEPAGRWRQPQNAEEIIGNQLEIDPACRPIRFLQNSYAKPRACKHRCVLVCGLPETPVSREGKEPLPIKRRLHRVKRVELRGLLYRQMRKQHSIEQLKNRQIGADANGQGKHRGGRKAG